MEYREKNQSPASPPSKQANKARVETHAGRTGGGLAHPPLFERSEKPGPKPSSSILGGGASSENVPCTPGRRNVVQRFADNIGTSIAPMRRGAFAWGWAGSKLWTAVGSCRVFALQKFKQKERKIRRDSGALFEKALAGRPAQQLIRIRKVEAFSLRIFSPQQNEKSKIPPASLILKNLKGDAGEKSTQFQEKRHSLISGVDGRCAVANSIPRMNAT